MRRLTWWRLRRRLAAMQLVVLDVDGVLTTDPRKVLRICWPP